MQGPPALSLPLATDGPGPAGAGLTAQVLAHAPMGIAVIDAEGIYRSVNPAHCALYGYRADELLGRHFTVIVPPDRQATAVAMHRAFIAGGAPMGGEFAVQHRDGRQFDVLLHSVVVQGADGRPNRLVYVLDITQRKQAERALQAQQQFLQSVLDALTAHVCVLDEQGVVLAVNRAWRDFGLAHGAPAGYSAVGASYLGVCGAAGAGPAELAGPDGGGVSPGAFAAQLQEVLDGRSDGFEAEYPCDTVQGPQWFLARVSRMAGNAPLRIVVAHDNITPLRRALHTLRDSEALLRDMAASIPGAMFRLQRRDAGRWRFSYVSPGIEPLFGLTPEQVAADACALGRRILDGDRAAHDAVVRRALAACQPFEHEYRIHSVDGALKWVHVSAVPKRDGDAAPIWTGMLQDVSARKHMEAVLRGSEERYRTLFETVAQGVVYQDAEGRITSANPAAQRILGRTLEQMQGQHADDPAWQAVREDGSPLAADQHPSIVALHSGRPVNDVVVGLPVQGRGLVWLLVNATPLTRQGVVHEVYASFEDITERVLLSQELKKQASTDDLTGVANRRSLMQRLALEFERVRRSGGSHRCSVLAVDLDLFKQVNDSHGHAAGDAVLQQVAAQMRQLTRQHDLVARSGGEEFMLLLPEAGPDDALALAERLRATLRTQPVQHEQLRLQVTVSVGVSQILPADTGVDAVLARADRALYAAKDGGRDRVCLAPAQG